MNHPPIGIFDSGIGGLTVAHAIIDTLPNESLLYFGDTARIPYGSKSAASIRQFSEEITQHLLQLGCKAIVVACNTASAAALDHLRQRWPEIPFVGMEPAVKPGAEATRSGVVGVLATAGTFRSQRYASLMKRYASRVTLLQDPCIGLVERIETGDIHSSGTEQLLRRIVQPMLGQGADTFVLGCTHYPFISPLLQRIIGTEKAIINPAPAVARQLSRVLEQKDLLAAPYSSPSFLFHISGPKRQFDILASGLLGFAVNADPEVSLHSR